MCGIVGYVGENKAKPIVLDGLKRLEYRGYDSAGFALFSQNDFVIKRNAGPVQELVASCGDLGETETQGIAHTRWATHGAPTESNAHPHRAGNLVLVHNGIIENYAQIREVLLKDNIEFKSQTDTEVFVQLIEYNRKIIAQEKPQEDPEKILMEALQVSMEAVEGHYAVLLMDRSIPRKIYGIQNGAPLVASKLKDGCIIASDIQAIVPYHNEVCFIPPGEIFVASHDGLSGQNLRFETIEWTADRTEKNGYDDYMLKEIFEQPTVVKDTLTKRKESPTALWKDAQKLTLVACGTSFHAAMTTKYLFEKFARLDCQVDIASEYRYRDPVISPQSLVGVISQSGETADTLAALRLANHERLPTFSICNVPNSTIARESSVQFPTYAGPEIGVASTKAFTAQLTLLSALALDAAKARGSDPDLQAIEALNRLPHDLRQVLESTTADCARIGENLKDQRMILFVGRGTQYPIALEGALKFKELTYLPAEGFAAGELKHGPIAYIDPQVSVVVLAPQDEWYTKSISNLEEIRARGGHIIAIGTQGDTDLPRLAHEFIPLPKVHSITQPIVSVLPLQMLAYYCARALGRNIDKPRNLAKSVTVE